MPEQAPFALYPLREFLGRELNSAYRIERLIGSGGGGAVFEATHLPSARPVAIKLLIGDTVSGLARFEREAEITQRLRHANIVEVVEFDVAGEGLPFIVMELLQGEDLRQRLQRNSVIDDLPFVCDLVQQTAAALTFAHGHGVVHRDLKPSNLFLCAAANGPEVVKVLDFGISKLIDSSTELTKTGSIVGTYTYMAPEQIGETTQVIDERIDIYAVGTIVYQLLSGQLPFAASTPPALLYKIVHQQPAPLDRLRPDLPPAISLVVHKAIAKRPEERFASIDAFSAALGEAVVAGDKTTVDAVRPTMIGDHEAALYADEVEATFVARPRRWPLLLGLLLTTLVLGAGMFWLGQGGEQAGLPTRADPLPATKDVNTDPAKAKQAASKVADVARPAATKKPEPRGEKPLVAATDKVAKTTPPARRRPARHRPTSNRPASKPPVVAKAGASSQSNAVPDKPPAAATVCDRFPVQVSDEKGNPGFARVTLAGQGLTRGHDCPCTFRKLPYGEYKLTAYPEGFKPIATTVQVTDKCHPVLLRLEPLP